MPRTRHAPSTLSLCDPAPVRSASDAPHAPGFEEVLAAQLAMLASSRGAALDDAIDGALTTFALALGCPRAALLVASPPDEARAEDITRERGSSSERARRVALARDVLALARGRSDAERVARTAPSRGPASTARDEVAIVGGSAAMRRVLEQVHAVARTEAAVLVRGESGVGKELVARAIHAASDRRDAPLVVVNCASIPRELFESEFFGHVKGAFTGASRDRAGRFELAHGGTLFLDEVGEIPLSEQAKLLRVLQEGAFERVGDDRTRQVDVRVIAATNRRLERDVTAGLFRRDLYFRLNVFPIEVPPLRARKEDVRPLAERFLTAYAARIGRPDLTLADADAALLAGYDFPGNVRELMHLLERAVILSGSGPLRLELPERSPHASIPPPAPVARTERPAAPERSVRTLDDLRAIELAMFTEALAASRGRVSGKGGAAEQLGLSPSTFRDRMKALGIKRD